MKNPRDEALVKGFGKNVRKYRNMKGLTMVQLAEICAVDYTTISKIERGIINTTLTMIVRIAKALDVNSSQLID